MKIIIIVFVLLFSHLAYADEWVVPDSEWHSYEQWRTVDTIRESVYVGLTIADLLQTHEIVKHNIREVNPFLGEHPSMARVNTFIVGSMVLHYEISKALPQELRDYWQYFFIFMEASTVHSNAQLGIHVQF